MSDFFGFQDAAGRRSGVPVKQLATATLLAMSQDVELPDELRELCRAELASRPDAVAMSFSKTKPNPLLDNMRRRRLAASGAKPITVSFQR